MCLRERTAAASPLLRRFSKGQGARGAPSVAVFTGALQPLARNSQRRFDGVDNGKAQRLRQLCGQAAHAGASKHKRAGLPVLGAKPPGLRDQPIPRVRPVILEIQHRHTGGKNTDAMTVQPVAGDVCLKDRNR